MVKTQYHNTSKQSILHVYHASVVKQGSVIYKRVFALDKNINIL